MNLDKLNLTSSSEGLDRSNEIVKLQFADSNLIPKPITYKDIDTEIVKFVDEKFNLTFDGNKVQTFFFAQQRMHEFKKTWEIVDENKMILPNFKIVVRETNPKPGSLMNGMSNIPGEPYFPVAVFEKWDGNKNITVTCKMRQPYAVDLVYNIKFVTNVLSLLNALNNKIINTFKSKQSYILINGRYMSVRLDDISDESDYSIDERKIFVQNFRLIVAAYIINEDDIIFEENVTRNLIGIELDHSKPTINSPMTSDIITVEFPTKGKNIISFKADMDFTASNVITDNIDSYEIKVNNIPAQIPFEIKKYDRINIKIYRINKNKLSIMKINKN